MIELIRSPYFQNLLDNFSVGVIIFNRTHSIYSVNNSASQILGLDLFEYMGKPWQELFPALDKRGQLDEMVERIIVGDPLPPHSIHSKFVRQDGNTRHFALSASSLIYGNKLFGIVLEINDISDVILMHERETRILEEKAALQRERYEALQRLSMSVSHQIRNPVMAIGGMTKLLTRHVDPSSREMEFAKALNDAARRLEDIVTAVFDYSAVHVGESAPADTEEIVRESIRMMALALPDLHRKLSWHVDVESCRLSLDRSALAAAMVELFANAAESTAQDPVNLSIMGRAARGTYSFEITDDGKGVCEENLRFVFDPFFTTKAVGVGMGLCKVERIVKELGGRISLNSSTESGTAVTIELPTS